MRLRDWLGLGKSKKEPPEEWWELTRRLENRMEQLELSWETTYQKVRSALGTLSKKQKREEENGADLSDQPLRSTESPYQEAMRRGLFGG